MKTTAPLSLVLITFTIMGLFVVPPVALLGVALIAAREIRRRRARNDEHQATYWEAKRAAIEKRQREVILACKSMP